MRGRLRRGGRVPVLPLPLVQLGEAGALAAEMAPYSTRGDAVAAELAVAPAVVAPAVVVPVAADLPLVVAARSSA